MDTDGNRQLVMICADRRSAELLMLEIEQLAKSLGVEVASACVNRAPADSEEALRPL